MRQNGADMGEIRPGVENSLTIVAGVRLPGMSRILRASFFAVADVRGSVFPEVSRSK